MSPAPARRPKASQTVLAFDFGEKRIGVAVGETGIGVAHPLATIHAESSEQRFAAIGAVIAEWQPARVVVGLPSHMDGVEHAMSARCRRFANQVHGRYGLPVSLEDERLTSCAADMLLRDATRRSRRNKGTTDSVAAQIILQGHLDTLLNAPES